MNSPEEVAAMEWLRENAVSLGLAEYRDYCRTLLAMIERGERERVAIVEECATLCNDKAALFRLRALEAEDEGNNYAARTCWSECSGANACAVALRTGWQMSEQVKKEIHARAARSSTGPTE